MYLPLMLRPVATFRPWPGSALPSAPLMARLSKLLVAKLVPKIPTVLLAPPTKFCH